MWQPRGWKNGEKETLFHWKLDKEEGLEWPQRLSQIDLLIMLEI